MLGFIDPSSGTSWPRQLAGWTVVSTLVVAAGTFELGGARMAKLIFDPPPQPESQPGVTQPYIMPDDFTFLSTGQVVILDRFMRGSAQST